jgi:succinate dehydrogenase hydrophobic anchor subunit
MHSPIFGRKEYWSYWEGFGGNYALLSISFYILVGIWEFAKDYSAKDLTRFYLAISSSSTFLSKISTELVFGIGFALN